MQRARTAVTCDGHREAFRKTDGRISFKVRGTFGGVSQQRWTDVGAWDSTYCLSGLLGIVRMLRER